jgi:hypothetical protein
MVPEGHCVHEQRTLIAKGLNLTVNPPVMHQTGETDWSPRNKDRHPSHHIVSHLPELHEAMGIDARLAVYLNANHELGRQQIDVALLPRSEARISARYCPHLWRHGIYRRQ